MRSDISVLLTVGVLFVLQLPLPDRGLAAEARQITNQEENRWIPSLSISGGALILPQDGFVDSTITEDGTTSPLQGPTDGDDLVVSPFVGAGLQLMTPALSIPTRPRFFLGGEILPTFGSEREVATQGDPKCISGPEVGAVCVDQLTGPLERTFPEDAAQGEGSNTVTLTDTLTFGASLGVAFPARLGGRQLRIKPSFGWLHYKIDGSGLVVNAQCDPEDRCTPEQGVPGGPITPGFLRDVTLMGEASKSFDAIGGGLDIEVDTVRYGPVGASLFLGGGFYRTVGDRTIGFSATQSDTDQIGAYSATANWEIEVDPWMYRAHVGIRFQWLGFPE
jgi:hypothetical protein